jgi:hypothetical protein
MAEDDDDAADDIGCEVEEVMNWVVQMQRAGLETKRSKFGGSIRRS